jgi:hypothetical protein
VSRRAAPPVIVKSVELELIVSHNNICLFGGYADIARFLRVIYGDSVPPSAYW